MFDVSRGWQLTRPRHPNFDCDPNLTIVIRADDWEQAQQLWQSMLSQCAPSSSPAAADRRG